MSPEQRAAFLDAAATAWGYRGDDQVWSAGRLIAREALNQMTAAGFVVTHPSVRDHTNCEMCGGFGFICQFGGWQPACGTANCAHNPQPCPAGRLVPWEPEGAQK